MNKLYVRNGAIGAMTALLLVAAPSIAHANPAPGSGPVAGGTTVTLPAPEGVTFTELYAGGFHTMATGSDGNTYAWGWNEEGQLGIGDNSTANRVKLLPVPVAQPDGVKFTDIQLGGYHSLALGDDGNLYSWGQNDKGQLGTGGTASVNVPTKLAVPGNPSFTDISGGEYYSLALTDEGVAYGWGFNRTGQTGTGDAAQTVEVPTEVDTPEGVKFTQLSAGTHHSLGIASNGKAYGWGSNLGGALGNNSTVNSPTPVEVQLPLDVTFEMVDAGGQHSLALGSDGLVYAWGLSAMGQIGNGSQASSPVPVPVSLPAGKSIVAVAASGFHDTEDETRADDPVAGGYHSLAITEDGKTWAWGGNQNGQIGNGSVGGHVVSPVEVTLPAGVAFTSVAAGIFHSLALGSDGKSYGWGHNSFGQLALGGTTAVAVPTEMRIAPTVTGISFDGIAGTDLAQAEDGSWTVVTPAHAAGPVDVTVEWEQFGVAQEPVVYEGGFTYIADATVGVSDPTDAQVVEGATATFSVTVTGAPASLAQWIVSTDGGKTFEPIDPAWAVSVSGNVSTLAFPAELAHSGYLFSAMVWPEGSGPMMSGQAKLTVTPKDSGGEGPGTPGTKPPVTTPPGGGGLPATGTQAGWGAAALAVSLIALGAAGFGIRRVTRREA